MTVRNKIVVSIWSKCWRQSWKTIRRIQFEKKIKWRKCKRAQGTSMLFPCICDVWKRKALRVNFQSASRWYMRPEFLVIACLYFFRFLYLPKERYVKCGLSHASIDCSNWLIIYARSDSSIFFEFDPKISRRKYCFCYFTCMFLF